MPREDSLSSRFDYLFEPLDDGVPADADTPVRDPSDKDKSGTSAAPVRMAFAAFVLGTLGVVAVIAVLLLQRPDGATDPVDLPRDPTPLSSTMPSVASQAVAVPPPQAPVPESTEAPQTIESVPAQQPPAQQPESETRAPQPRPTNPPTTRAPISVAPEIRSPTPSPAPGSDGGSGLLGGRGLL